MSKDWVSEGCPPDTAKAEYRLRDCSRLVAQDGTTVILPADTHGNHVQRDNILVQKRFAYEDMKDMDGGSATPTLDYSTTVGLTAPLGEVLDTIPNGKARTRDSFSALLQKLLRSQAVFVGADRWGCPQSQTELLSALQCKKAEQCLEKFKNYSMSAIAAVLAASCRRAEEAMWLLKRCNQREWPAVFYMWGVCAIKAVEPAHVPKILAVASTSLNPGVARSVAHLLKNYMLLHPSLKRETAMWESGEAVGRLCSMQLSNKEMVHAGHMLATVLASIALISIKEDDLAVQERRKNALMGQLVTTFVAGTAASLGNVLFQGVGNAVIAAGCALGAMWAEGYTYEMGKPTKKARSQDILDSVSGVLNTFAIAAQDNQRLAVFTHANGMFSDIIQLSLLS